MTLIRFRRDLLSVLEQPETFAYRDADQQPRIYTPDFRVQFIDRTVYYEVKYKTQLAEDWPRFRVIIPFMRRHLREKEGAYFRVITDKSIRSVKFENIRLLAPHLTRLPDPIFAGQIGQFLAEKGPTTIGGLLDGRAGIDRAQFYAALWPLVAQRRVIVDLNQPLCMQSIVRGCDG